MSDFFSNHTEYEFWSSFNCWKCKKYTPESEYPQKCAIQNALLNHIHLDEKMPTDILERSGGIRVATEFVECKEFEENK